MLALISGNLVYQLTRLAYIRRRRNHRPVDQTELETIFDAPAPPLLIIVSAYCEERRTIWQTMFSGALQEYSNRKVVLLIDDSVMPAAPENAGSLGHARRIPYQPQAVMDVLAQRLGRELRNYEPFLIKMLLDLA